MASDNKTGAALFLRNPWMFSRLGLSQLPSVRLPFCPGDKSHSAESLLRGSENKVKEGWSLELEVQKDQFVRLHEH
jgi:hypothetical protein